MNDSKRRKKSYREKSDTNWVNGGNSEVSFFSFNLTSCAVPKNEKGDLMSEKKLDFALISSATNQKRLKIC